MKRLSIIVIGVLLTLAQLSQVFRAEKMEVNEKDKKKRVLPQPTLEQRKEADISRHHETQKAVNARQEKIKKKFLWKENIAQAICDYATVSDKDKKEFLGLIKMETETDLNHWWTMLSVMRTQFSEVTKNLELCPNSDSFIEKPYVDYLRAGAAKQIKETPTFYAFKSDIPDVLIKKLVDGFYIYPSNLGFKYVTAEEYFNILGLRDDAISMYLSTRYIQNQYGVTLD